MDQSVFTAGNKARTCPQQLHRLALNIDLPLVRLAERQQKTPPKGLWSWTSVFFFLEFFDCDQVRGQLSLAAYKSPREKQKRFATEPLLEKEREALNHIEGFILCTAGCSVFIYIISDCLTLNRCGVSHASALKGGASVQSPSTIFFPLLCSAEGQTMCFQPVVFILPRCKCVFGVVAVLVWGGQVSSSL